MKTIAIRNRAIKATLETAFGKGKVRVRGSRGTAYGWVHVTIDWTPLDADQSREMQGHCKALLRAAGIDLGHTYTDDTCQWASDQCQLGFNQARYFRTMKHSDGSMSVLRHYGAEWTMETETPSAAAADAMDDFNHVSSRHHY